MKDFIFPLLFFVSLIGCDSSAAKSPYQVIDSEIWSNADSAPRGRTWWLDNERVIFPSNETLAPRSESKITIWNTASYQIAFSHPWDTVFCVSEGKVFYALENKSTKTVKVGYYRGSLDNTPEYPFPGNTPIDDRFDCGWVPKASFSTQPPATGGPYRYKLRGENYLDIVEVESKSSKGRVIYHAWQNDNGKEMPFYPMKYTIIYSEFLDAYVMARGDFNPANPEARSFWILDRNGDLKEVPYPPSLLKGRVAVYPLKQGYLVHYNSGKLTMTDSGDRGLYLMQGEKVQRLVVGSVYGVSISPNGCKAAFIHARNTKEYLSQTKPYRTVKFIDFCKGESQS